MNQERFALKENYLQRLQRRKVRQHVHTKLELVDEVVADG